MKHKVLEIEHNEAECTLLGTISLDGACQVNKQLETFFVNYALSSRSLYLELEAILGG